MNNNDTYVSLDIGTSTVKVLIGEMAGDSLNVIGIGKADSNGLKKGSIVDIDETVRSIQNAVEQAERMVGSKVQSVIVGVTGNHIQLHPCHGVVAISSENREVSDDDITRVMEAAQVMPIDPAREIIDTIHHEFIVDGLEGINDPRGMVGVRLEMRGIVITGSKTILHNLERCVEKAGLEIADICLTPLALSSVALTRDEKNLGVALIDIGGGTTKVAVFDQGILVDTFVLPIGGDHITKDISIGLRTTTDYAEAVKLKYGHAFIDYASTDGVVPVQKLNGSEDETISERDLAYIIEPRVAEIFELINEEFRRSGFQKLPGGYILTGGVAAMEGILDLAQHEINHNVRVAIPDYIGVREPQYTTCVGLINFAYHHVKIQGREIGRAIAPGSFSGQGQQRKSKVKAEKNPNRDHGGVTKKVKQLFDSFFD